MAAEHHEEDDAARFARRFQAREPDARERANTCPACGHTWTGRGAGVAGDACPMLGCTGRVTV